ncbi:FxSxx-COOH system tetratricopeptide repeat protein [Streptomyces sp. NPDC001868]|uniref:FxSxx-COOH system tetratricopeptide repeat protein n=1 Tax=Streptomyces sp. NPDC001868 TaxID=3154401 RepID=UPI00331C2A11
MNHYSISYAGFNRPWATWIAHQLESLGYRTTLLRWDPPISVPLAVALRSLLDSPGRVLLVLDDWYFNLGPRTDEEWMSALRDVVSEHEDRIAAVSVATRAIPPGGERLQPVDLRDLEEGEARRRILARLGVSAAHVLTDGGSAPRFPNDPPSVLNIPRRNLRFTGRDWALEELQSLLNRGGDSGSRVSLRGISGVGKSQIAIEYAHRFGNDYDVVWWVNAGFRATAREQFGDLATHLDVSVGREVGERIRAVQEALRTGKRHRRWLIIFDSADDMSQIEDLLPRGNGHVLVTTLTQDWATSGSLAEIPVPSFLREESVAYVRRRAPRLTEREADQLAEAVQDLPLLLAQTAAWLDTNRMPAKDYIELVRKGGASQIGIRISDDYPMGFQTSWSITLNTLEVNYPEAAELLRLFALFSPDSIPVRLIQTAHPSDLPDHLAALAADPTRWYSALQRLSESTAVQLDYDSSSEDEPQVGGATMHRLYQSFLNSTQSEDRREGLSSAACEVLARADPRRPSDDKTWSTYADLLPHLEVSGALDSSRPVVRKLVLNCIDYLRARDEGREGLALCEKAVARWRTRLGADDPDMLVLTYQHANMLRRVGRFREAQAAGQLVVDRLSSFREPEDRDLLTAKNVLGGSLLALGAYDKADRLYEEVAEIRGRLSGEDSLEALQARTNHATSAALLGRYEEAAEQHRQIFEQRSRLFGPVNQLTLLSELHCAWILRLLGRYEEASGMQKGNLSRLQKFGESHEYVLLAEHNLALCRRRSGNLAEAGSQMRRVVERSLRKHGSGHPRSLHAQADYATFVREHGDLAEARELASQVNAGYTKLVGPDHPFTIGTESNLGLVLWKYAERDESLRIAETTTADMRELVGPDHPFTLGCAINLAGARNFAGDEEGALRLSRETLELARRAMGENHPMTLSCKAVLSADLRSVRRGQEARKLEQETLGKLTERYGSSHPHTMAVGRRERPYWDFEPQPT